MISFSLFSIALLVASAASAPSGVEKKPFLLDPTGIYGRSSMSRINYRPIYWDLESELAAKSNWLLDQDELTPSMVLYSSDVEKKPFLLDPTGIYGRSGVEKKPFLLDPTGIYGRSSMPRINYRPNYWDLESELAAKSNWLLDQDELTPSMVLYSSDVEKKPFLLDPTGIYGRSTMSRINYRPNYWDTEPRSQPSSIVNVRRWNVHDIKPRPHTWDINTVFDGCPYPSLCIATIG